MSEKKREKKELASPQSVPAATVLGSQDLVSLINHRAGFSAALSMSRVNKDLSKDPYKYIKNELGSWKKQGKLIENCCKSIDHARVLLHEAEAYGIHEQDFFTIANSHKTLGYISDKDFKMPLQDVVIAAMRSPDEFSTLLRIPKARSILEKHFNFVNVNSKLYKYPLRTIKHLDMLDARRNQLKGFLERWQHSLNSYPKVVNFILSSTIFADESKERLSYDYTVAAKYYLKKDLKLFTGTSWNIYQEACLLKLFERHKKHNLIYWAIINPDVCKFIPWVYMMENNSRITEVVLKCTGLEGYPFDISISDWFSVAKYFARIKPELSQNIIDTFGHKFNKRQLETIAEEVQDEATLKMPNKLQSPAETKKKPWSNFFTVSSHTKDSKKNGSPVKEDAHPNSAPESRSLSKMSSTSGPPLLCGSEPSRPGSSVDTIQEDDAKIDKTKVSLSDFLTRLEDKPNLTPRQKIYVSQSLKKIASIDSSNRGAIEDWIAQEITNLFTASAEGHLQPQEAEGIRNLLIQFQWLNSSTAKEIIPSPSPSRRG